MIDVKIDNIFVVLKISNDKEIAKFMAKKKVLK